jgi:hypothetical protein
VKRSILLAVGFVLGIAALALGPVPPAHADIAYQLDHKAAELPCTKWWNGKAPRIAKLKGKVVLLHFSDPRKLTSKAFAGQVKEMHTRFKDKGLVLIEVLQMDSEVEGEAYVATAGADWPVGLDGKGNAEAAYMGSSLPRSYLIGPDGKIAWHAHVAALKTDVIEAQLARIPFFDTKGAPQRAKQLCKLAAAQKYGSALKEADKILRDSLAPDDAKRLASVLKADVDRTFGFHWKILEKQVKELDWANAYRLVEHMEKIYKRTPHEKAVHAKFESITGNARAKWVLAAQIQLERITAKTKTRTKKNLESVIRELKLLAVDHPDTIPAQSANDWIKKIQAWIDAK